MYAIKTAHLDNQKFEEVVTDQIKQQNLRLEDEIQDQKEAENRKTPEYISKTKRWILWTCAGISLVFFPILISVLTRKKLEREKEQ